MGIAVEIRRIVIITEVSLMGSLLWDTLSIAMQTQISNSIILGICDQE